MDDDAASGRDAADLVLDVLRRGTVATLTMHGELDASTAPKLADICRSVHAQGARDVVIDLTDTSFLDSSGLRALIGAHQLFGADGGSVRLLHPRDPVIRLLDLTGLGDYFSITVSVPPEAASCTRSRASAPDA